MSLKKKRDGVWVVLKKRNEVTSKIYIDRNEANAKCSRGIEGRTLVRTKWGEGKGFPLHQLLSSWTSFITWLYKPGLSLIFLLIYLFSFSMLTLLEVPVPWGLIFWQIPSLSTVHCPVFRYCLHCACIPGCFSRDQLFATLWTVAYQAPLSRGILQAMGNPWNG